MPQKAYYKGFSQSSKRPSLNQKPVHRFFYMAAIHNVRVPYTSLPPSNLNCDRRFKLTLLKTPPSHQRRMHPSSALVGLCLQGPVHGARIALPTHFSATGQEGRVP